MVRFSCVGKIVTYYHKTESCTLGATGPGLNGGVHPARPETAKFAIRMTHGLFLFC